MANCGICEDGESPVLGAATTRQLIEEIRARGETATIGIGNVLGEAMAGAASALLQDLPENALNYRTVDS